MIRAAEKSWFKKLWRTYIRFYLLWRHFAIVRLKGRIDPVANGPRRPVIYIANHSNWWDGLLAFDAFIPRTQYKHFVMMDEKQLRQFRFFRYAGVFSIDKTKPAAVVESLQYASTLLEANHALWIFPQGDIRHQEKRPLQFFSGVGYLLQKVPHAVVVPVTIYYAFGNRQKPEASLWFGTPVEQSWETWERKQMTEYLRVQLESQLNSHRDLYMDERNLAAEGFQVTMKTGSTDAAFVAFKKWVKSWFMRSRR